VAARRLTGVDNYGGAGVVGAVPRAWCARLRSWLCRCLMLLIACRRWRPAPPAASLAALVASRASAAAIEIELLGRFRRPGQPEIRMVELRA
jgi:hypothetical protein